MQTTLLLAKQARLQRLTFALFVAILSGMVAIYVVLDYRHVRATESDKLVTQAHIVSANIEMHITSIDRVLEEILALHEFTDLEQQRDHMQSLVNAMPIIRAISILDQHGIQMAGTRDSNNGTDFSDRPYFRNARSEPQPLQLHISTPYLTVSGDVTIALSKAIRDRRGRFVGVVAAAVEAGYIKGLMESTLYAPDMWAALRHIDSSTSIRVGGDATLLLTRHDEASSHQMAASSPVTASSIISATAVLPLQITTGRDYHSAMADWRRFAYLQGGLLALFIITTTAGLLFVQQRHRNYALGRIEYLRRIKQDQERLQAQEQDYRIIVERTTTCIIRLDVHGKLSYANPAFCKLLDIAAGDAVGRRFASLMADDDIETAEHCVNDVLRQAFERHLRTKCLTPTGLRHMEWALCPVIGPENSIRGVIGIGHDISAHIDLHERLRSLADHDGLTGLFNRRYFMETSAVQIRLAHRQRTPLSFMTLDLDHFKKVNDSRGHLVGDIALQTCARLMQHSCREFDLPARVGGEEFAILLPGTALEDAVRAAERLRLTIEQHPIILEDGDHFHLTASFGVSALLPGEDIEGLMRRADVALYAAKQNGRNRVEIAQETAVA